MPETGFKLIYKTYSDNGDASEVRTHMMRMKISYPDQLDDGAKCSGL